jgi:type II secretory pathway pseudopilin PulG
MRRGSGFILVMLLVVIALIATLTAMLFPVFARARDKMRHRLLGLERDQVPHPVGHVEDALAG